MKTTRDELVEDTLTILERMKREVSKETDPDLILFNALITHISPYSSDKPRDLLIQNYEIARCISSIWNNRSHRFISDLVQKAHDGFPIQTVDILEAADRIKAIRQITSRIITFAAGHINKVGGFVEERESHYILFDHNGYRHVFRYYPHLQACALIRYENPELSQVIFYSTVHRKAKKQFTAYISGTT